MKMILISRQRTRWHLLVIVLISVAAGTYIYLSGGAKKVARTATGLTGVQHLGPDYNIFEFFVNGYSGMNVGRGGGGGRNVCCVMLPDHWLPGMTVDVRWGINDWRLDENEPQFGGIYRAQVPVEKYEAVDQVYVHFFPGGRVRVLVGPQGPSTAGFAKSRQDPHASDGATVGVRVEEMFTKAELEVAEKKIEESRKKYGDWR